MLLSCWAMDVNAIENPTRSTYAQNVARNVARTMICLCAMMLSTLGVSIWAFCVVSLTMLFEI